MKRLIIIVFILPLLASSCVYQSMTNFNDEDLLWLNAYTPGEKIPFISIDGIADTTKIDHIKISNDKCPVFFNTNLSAPFVYHAYGHIDFIVNGLLPKGRRYLNGLFSCVRQSPDSLVASIFLNDFRCFRKLVNTLDVFTIDGVEYSDCLVLTLDDKDCYQHGYESRDSTVNLSVTGLVWSRSKGLLQYTVDSTYTFTRTP